MMMLVSDINISEKIPEFFRSPKRPGETESETKGNLHLF